jgi:hypothetical protein
MLTELNLHRRFAHAKEHCTVPSKLSSAPVNTVELEANITEAMTSTVDGVQTRCDAGLKNLHKSPESLDHTDQRLYADGDMILVREGETDQEPHRPTKKAHFTLTELQRVVPGNSYRLDVYERDRTDCRGRYERRARRQAEMTRVMDNTWIFAPHYMFRVYTSTTVGY